VKPNDQLLTPFNRNFVMRTGHDVDQPTESLRGIQLDELHVDIDKYPLELGWKGSNSSEFDFANTQDLYLATISVNYPKAFISPLNEVWPGLADSV
jgi:hypothetical protein